MEESIFKADVIWEMVYLDAGDLVGDLSFVISFEPKARMNSRYAEGEISDGLISDRPPQKTLV